MTGHQMIEAFEKRLIIILDKHEYYISRYERLQCNTIHERCVFTLTPLIDITNQNLSPCNTHVLDELNCLDCYIGGEIQS